MCSRMTAWVFQNSCLFSVYYYLLYLHIFCMHAQCVYYTHIASNHIICESIVKILLFSQMIRIMITKCLGCTITMAQCLAILSFHYCASAIKSDGYPPRFVKKLPISAGSLDHPPAIFRGPPPIPGSVHAHAFRYYYKTMQE